MTPTRTRYGGPVADLRSYHGSPVSLILPPGCAVPAEPVREPECFGDLHLDRIVTSLVAGRAEYHLEPLLYAPLATADAVGYRHAVLRDLEHPALVETVGAFADGMRAVRTGRQRTSGHHRLQHRIAFLEAAVTYARTVRGFADGLMTAPHTSTAMAALTDYVTDHVRSAAFVELEADAAAVQRGLRGAVYRLRVSDHRVTVSRPVADERDYAVEVAAGFTPFRPAHPSGRAKRAPERPELNPVDEAIAERVELLYPAEFAALERFYTRHDPFVDPGLGANDRELQFYLAGKEWADRLRAAGLPMCLPEVSADAREIEVVDAFDAALAQQRVWDRQPVVLNDVHLAGDERVLVVTGPNQGGKTTFARMVGQLAHLASLGLPVPGRSARLPLPDLVLTHFERSENLGDLRGALEDDLVRLRAILQTATPRSLIILNEILTSTTVQDAALLSRRVLTQVMERDCVCVCVTFLGELAGLSPAVVSLVSQVDPDDPTVRTFKVVRQPSGGPTYAEVLARLHGLDGDTLRRRLAR